ncbi:hypothetical protein [Alteriqipengyuania sp. 357]
MGFALPNAGRLPGVMPPGPFLRPKALIAVSPKVEAIGLRRAVGMANNAFSEMVNMIETLGIS